MDGHMEWVYRVSSEMTKKLQDAMVRNLDVLSIHNLRLYFYEDGRGVMTVDADHVHKFPSPPAPLAGKKLKLNHFEGYITASAKELDGITIMPWGGSSVKQNVSLTA
jgi:2,3-bisphosphoglycerate-independent phosphoglycerate mutase